MLSLFMSAGKKTLAAAYVSIVVIAVLFMSGVAPANANPLIFYPEKPNTDPPTIQILLPAQDSRGNLTLNVTVTKPDSWWWNYEPGGNGTPIGW